MRRRDQPVKVRNRGPLYLHIAVTLRRDIASGILKPNEQLPAISELARTYNVAVVTIRQAMEVLEQEGLIKRFQGRGTFVADEPPTSKNITLKSDWASLLKHLEGKRPTLIKVADRIATPMLDPNLGKVEREYRYMQRVHTWDGVRYALINIYLSQRIYDLDPTHFDEGMVISRLSEMPEARIGRLQQRVSFTTANPETAELLELPINSAIGDVLRVITDVDGMAIYVGQTKYRGDFVNLEFDLMEPPK